MDDQLKKILNYLFGEMSADENRLFELDNDQKLRETLQYVKKIDEVLADDDLLRFYHNLKKAARQYKLLYDTDEDYEVTMPEILQLIKEVDNYAINEKEFAEIEHLQYESKYQNDDQIRPSLPESKSAGVRQQRIGKKVFAAVAVVLVLMISSVIYRNLTQNNNKQIFASYYQPYNYYIVSSRLAGTSNDILNATHLYKKGNYKEALDQLKHVIKVDPKNKAAHFFTGVSFLELKDFDKATENLLFVINQKDIFYARHAEWYLTLCYLAMGQTNNASAMLCRVAVSENVYKSKALEILKKLN